MTNRRKIIISLVLLLTVVLSVVLKPRLIPLITGKRRQSVSAWTNAGRSLSTVKSIDSHGRNLSIVSPIWYVVNKQGGLERAPRIDKRVIKAARDADLLIVPSISNEFEAGRVSKLLTDKNIQNKFIDDVFRLIKKEGYDGIDLDFENFRVADRDRYTRFVARLKSASAGSLVTVDLLPKTFEPGSWEGPQALDYKGLGRVADMVRIMAYDEHYAGGEPGPTASIAWVRKVLKFSLTKIPRDKLILGIPLYGYDWTVGGQGVAVGYDTAQALAKRYQVRVRWNKHLAAPWFSYNAEGKQHIVWFSDARGLAAVLDLPEAADIRGFCLFRLGIEDPRIWKEIDKRIYLW